MSQKDNRVERDLAQESDRFRSFNEALGPDGMSNREVQRSRLRHLRRVYYKYQFSVRSKEEQRSLELLGAQIRGMERQLRRPQVRVPLLFRLPVALLRLATRIITGTLAYSYRTLKGMVDLRRQDATERKHAEQLNQQLSRLGFGSEIPVVDHVQHRNATPQNFTMHQKPGQHMDVSVQYKMGEDGLQAISGYEARLRVGGDIRRQYFPVDSGRAFNADEAFNLLSGRAVNRQFVNAEGGVSSQWVELDMTAKDTKGNYLYRQFGERYGFNIGEALKDLPLKTGMLADERVTLGQQLQRGERAKTVLRKGGKDITCYVEADPANKSLRFFNSDQVPVKKEDILNTGRQAKPTVPMKNTRPQKQQHTRRLSVRVRRGNGAPPMG